MGEEGKIFSDEQRDIIYTEMLKPIKVKISEILLYDTEAALRFLQKYNDILKSIKEQEILSKITDLEFEISEYERNAGNQKLFEYKSQSIIQQIKDMQIDGDRLSLEELESEFSRLRQTYQTNFQKYSFQDRDAIEQQLYELYGKVMLRRVRDGAIEENKISPEDVIGMTIFVNKEIGKLSQNTNPIVQNAIERIKFKLMDGEKAFQDDEIWKLLIYAQEQKYEEPNQSIAETKQPTITALAIVNEKKGLLDRVKKVFKKEPQLPLQIEDLSKITVDWLAKYIPKEMLTKIEEERLKEEGKNPENRYQPDSKTVIYDFIGKSEGCALDLLKGGYEYQDENGNKHIITLEKYGRMRLIPKYLDDGNRTRMTDEITVNPESCVEPVLGYAILLDDVFGTNLANDLACEYGEFIRKPKSTIIAKFNEVFLGIGYGYSNEDFSTKSKIFKNLLKSYSKIAEECKKTESSYRTSEYAERKSFYEKSKFREEMKQSLDNQNCNITQEEIQEGKKEQLNQEEPDI